MSLTLSEITTGVQSFSVTGALVPTAGLDISATTGDFTLCVEMVALTAAKNVRLQLEASVNAFTTTVALEVLEFAGQVGPGAVSGTAFAQGTLTPSTDKFSIRKYQMPKSAAQYFGVASAVLRLNVTGIDASTEGAVHAWMES